MSKTIRVGINGFGRIGRLVYRIASEEPNIEIVAVCDCDRSKLDRIGALYPQLKEKKLTRYPDMRKMFDDKSVDAVSNSQL